MSKGLEALKENRKLVLFNSVSDRAKYSDNTDIIEKELKALEIIKEKQVNVSALLELDDLEQYNGYCAVVGGCKYLTPKEYDLLKEVLL